jgi:hypothetical protein
VAAWAWAEFMDEVRAGHVRRVEIEDQEIILIKKHDSRTVSHRLR